MSGTTSRSPSTAAIQSSVWFGPLVSAGDEHELIDQLRSAHGVGVCCWPRDAERVKRLAAAEIPRLLLVGPEAAPPPPARWQAWIGKLASSAEVHEALVRLCASAGGAAA